jgi:hypothetical protein
MNPFLMGLMSMTGAMNPEMFSQAMAAQGVAPGAMPNQFMGMQPQDPLGGYLTGSAGMMEPQATTAGWEATVNPTAQAGAPPGAQMPFLGSMLQGVKTPTAPTPIMSGGVAGSQKAPDPQLRMGQGALGAEIMKLISGGGNQNPLRVPALGSLIQGGI